MKQKIMQIGRVLILLVIIASSSCSKQPSEKVTREIVSAYLGYLENNDFESATALFHFPANYTAEELSNDRNAISKALAIVSNEFGGIGRVNKIDSADNYIFLVLSGGNLAYWDQHSYSIPVIHEVTFSNEGAGYLIFFICKVEKRWEIQKIEYCLPVSRPDSKERINQITRKIFEPLLPAKPKIEDAVLNT